jgi:hypothetical protein
VGSAAHAAVNRVSIYVSGSSLKTLFDTDLLGYADPLASDEPLLGDEGTLDAATAADPKASARVIGSFIRVTCREA